MTKSDDKDVAAKPVDERSESERRIAYRVPDVYTVTTPDEKSGTAKPAGKRPEIDRRLSYRVDVQRGEIIVHWANKNGSPGLGMALDISDRGIRFESINFDTKSITGIECPRFKIELSVLSSSVLRFDAGQAVVIIDEFNENEQSWKIWKRLASRINCDTF